MGNFKMKLSFGIGALGKDYACAIIYLFLMYYLTDVALLNPAFVGGLFLFARLWDAINDPMMGMIVDNTRSKWGKFRPWIMIGTILNAIVLILMFFKPEFSKENSLYIYVAIVYILWGMTYTVMDIPFWSMIPAIASEKREREQLAVIPRIFASLAWLTTGSFTLVVVKYLGKGNQGDGFFKLALYIAIFFIFASALTVMNVKEKVVSNNITPKTNLKTAFKLIFTNDQLVALIGTILMYNLVVQISGGISIYYFKYVINNENMYSVFTGLAGLAEIGSLVLFPIISPIIGRKKVFFLACFLPVLGYVALFMTGNTYPDKVFLIALCGVIAKLGSGLSLGISTVMLADVVDYGEYKFGSRNESIIFSVQTMLVKSASAVAGLLIGLGLSFVGYIPNVVQTEAAINGITALMVGVPAVLSAIGYIIYKKYYKLNDEFYDNIITELKQRKEK